MLVIFIHEFRPTQIAADGIAHKEQKGDDEDAQNDINCTFT
jgi:hypothetical protein